MEGFYSKLEASRVLSVSVRQIGYYLQNGKLRKIDHARKVFIPKEDVEKLYDDKAGTVVPSRDEFVGLQRRIESLEETVEALKLMLGHGMKKPERSEGELLLFRSSVMEDLSRSSWTFRHMHKVAEDVATLRESEISTLYYTAGPTAWTPFFDLLQKMIEFAEKHPAYPDRGLDILHSKLVGAKDRFFGLLQASTKVRTAVSPKEAVTLLKEISPEPSAIDQFVVQYIAASVEI